MGNSHFTAVDQKQLSGVFCRHRPSLPISSSVRIVTLNVQRAMIEGRKEQVRLNTKPSSVLLERDKGSRAPIRRRIDAGEALRSQRLLSYDTYATIGTTLYMSVLSSFQRSGELMRRPYQPSPALIPSWPERRPPAGPIPA